VQDGLLGEERQLRLSTNVRRIEYDVGSVETPSVIAVRALTLQRTVRVASLLSPTYCPQ